MIDIVAPSTYEDVQEIVRTGANVLACGGGSKPGLSTAAAGWQPLSMGGLSGIVEYQPSEFTITAQAGTPLQHVIAALAEKGQYFPWDPPFVESGATIGGAIAAGLSGSGRYRYGGLRDFLVGVRFVDGTGRLVRGGGKVVKNAAGFDLPKLLIGSLGRLALLVEATFKVFPAPPAWTTMRVECRDIVEAAALMATIGRAPLDVHALDLEVEPASTATLWLRLGGMAAALPERRERLSSYLGVQTVTFDEDENQYWQSVARADWASDASHLIYASISPSQLARVESMLVALQAPHRYAVGGNIAWIALNHGDDQALTTLSQRLQELAIPALLLRGSGDPMLGAHAGAGLLRRVKAVLDPAERFPAFSGD